MDENLHGVLHGIQWITFHVLQDLHQAHLKGVGLPQNGETVTLQNLTALNLL